MSAAHVRLRSRERYGTALTLEDVDSLRDTIRSGAAAFIRHAGRLNRAVWRVALPGGVACQAVYDEARETLVTLLPDAEARLTATVSECLAAREAR